MADLRWDSVNANFNDVNSAMGNAINGISQAGTIFGELRKSILEEEQRAVDNAFREKQFNEQVSQFAATHGLNEEQLREQIRHSQESERLTGEGHEVQKRGQNLYHKAAMAGVGAQNDGNALNKRKYDDERDSLAIQTQVTRDVLAPYYELKEEEANLIAAINSGGLTDDELAEKETRLDQIEGLKRTDFSARDLSQKITLETVKRGGGVMPVNALTEEAANERARTAAAMAKNAKAEADFEQSQVKANQIQAGLNLGTEDSPALQRAMSMVQQQYPTLKPEIAMSILTSFYPTTGEIFSTKEKFDAPITETDYLVKFKPTDGKNPIAVRLAQAASEGKNLLSGSGDTTEIPDPTPKEQLIDFSALTNEALAYQREKILASQPSEPSSEQIQTRFNQLVRSSWGDMPTDKIPPNALKTLEERALQDARTTIQKERTQATSYIDNEIFARRQRMTYR